MRRLPKHQTAAYEPTAEDIARECRALQDTWTETQTRMRAGANWPAPVELAEVSLPHGVLSEALNLS